MPSFRNSDVKAFMGLIRLMAGLDQTFSPDEATYLDKIATEIGREAFWRHMEDSYKVELSADEVWALAEDIDDPDIQEIIYGNLYELSIAGGIEPAEANMLDRLSKLWQLQVTQVDERPKALSDE